jgi:GNAT superfamily N-acetyltransferase
MALLEEIEPGNPPGLEAARMLLDDLLGAGLYPAAKAADIAQDREAQLLVAREGDDVLGAAVCRLLYPEDADYYRAFGATALDLFSRHRVGSLEALAVRPPSQRRGLGSQLTRAQMGWLAAAGRDVAVAVSWIPDSVSASGPMYQRLGFTGTAPVANFYLEESMEEGWTCPQCQGPCHCAAAMYYARLS